MTYLEDYEDYEAGGRRRDLRVSSILAGIKGPLRASVRRSAERGIRACAMPRRGVSSGSHVRI